MTTLPTADRTKVFRGIMRYWSQERSTISGINKSDLQSAIDATDNWIDQNQADYVASLPATFRNNSTPAQKILLFCVVATMRASAALAQRLIGGLD